MYPAADPYAYGENCYALAFLFLFFKAITYSDIWACYFFITVLYALNAYAIYRLIYYFVKDHTVAFITGLAFAASGFLLSNIDDSNCIFLFFPVMAIMYFERGVDERNTKDIRRAFLFSAIQIWFGFYVFTFQFFMMALLFLFRIKILKTFFTLKNFIQFSLYYCLISLPLISIYFFNHFTAGVTYPYNNAHSTFMCSFNWNHFWNVLSDNLLYSSKTNIYSKADDNGWVIFRMNAFPGIVFPLLSMLGIWRSIKKTKWIVYLVAAVLFFTLSFGVHSPVFNLFAKLPLAFYMRVPFRFYLFTLIGLSVFFAFGLQWMLEKGKSRKTLLAVLVAVLFMAENIPYKMLRFDYGAIITPPASYVQFFKKFPQRQIIADYPSEYLCLIPDFTPLWSYSRDILYMNWQTYHHQIIVNGANSYVPASRSYVDYQIKKLPDLESLFSLKKLGVTYIVFHKKFVLLMDENILFKFNESPYLKKQIEDADIAIFRIDI